MRRDFAERLESCAAFKEGVPSGVCWSDGHYICQECEHLSPRKTSAGQMVEEDEWLLSELNRAQRRLEGVKP